MAKREPSIDQHAADIEYIKKDIAEIKERLDKKYVSHETFDLSIRAINDAIGWIVKVAIFVIAPIYAAVITLMFKAFTQ
jgi:hypothetical protein